VYGRVAADADYRSPGAIMGLIRLIARPIRSIVRFPPFQIAVVIVIILLLEAASDNSVFGQIYRLLDNLVGASIKFVSAFFELRSFTSAGLVWAFGIAYVYIVLLLILLVARIVIEGVVDLIGWSNFLYLRNAIARERGVAAYRAWLPLERIRPARIPQDKWEATFAWPPNNRPPYPPLPVRVLRDLLSYVIVIAVIAILLQFFTPFPALTWLGRLIGVQVNF
jgi:hypothetical protein